MDSHGPLPGPTPPQKKREGIKRKIRHLLTGSFFCLGSRKKVWLSLKIIFIFVFGCFYCFSDVGRRKRRGIVRYRKFCQKEIRSLTILKKPFVSTSHIRIKVGWWEIPNGWWSADASHRIAWNCVPSTKWRSASGNKMLRWPMGKCNNLSSVKLDEFLSPTVFQFTW